MNRALQVAAGIVSALLGVVMVAIIAVMVW